MKAGGVRKLDFADLEITPRLYSILILIKTNPGCRQTDIGAALGALQTNLVRRIDILVERGLVTRAPDPLDRRGKVLRLTPAGEEMALVAQQRHRELVEHMERQGAETDYPRLLTSVAKFVAATPSSDFSDAED